MIYEERRTVVEPKRVQDYLRLFDDKLGHSNGGNVICRLSGLIGAPQNEFLQMTSYPDINSWEKAQHNQSHDLEGLVQSEEARLLRSISSRPKVVIPTEDYRAVYGHRRFIINSSDIDEFVHCSEDGIWPRIESQGACILGLWTTISSDLPMEITLITGYHSSSHWEETRFGGTVPVGVDKDEWEKEQPLRQRRADISLRSWVRLMRAHSF